MNQPHHDTSGPEVTVDFRALGDDFDPAILTAGLGIEPTRQWRHGELIPERPGLQRKGVRTYVGSSWIWGTESQETWDVAEPLSQVLHVLQGKEDALAGLAAAHGLEYRFEIVVRLVGGRTPAFQLDREALSFAHRVAATFDIDLYADPELCAPPPASS